MNSEVAKVKWRAGLLFPGSTMTFSARDLSRLVGLNPSPGKDAGESQGVTFHLRGDCRVSAAARAAGYHQEFFLT